MKVVARFRAAQLVRVGMAMADGTLATRETTAAGSDRPRAGRLVVGEGATVRVMGNG